MAARGGGGRRLRRGELLVVVDALAFGRLARLCARPRLRLRLAARRPSPLPPLLRSCILEARALHGLHQHLGLSAAPLVARRPGPRAPRASLRSGLCRPYRHLSSGTTAAFGYAHDQQRAHVGAAVLGAQLKAQQARLTSPTVRPSRSGQASTPHGLSSALAPSSTSTAAATPSSAPARFLGLGALGLRTLLVLLVLLVLVLQHVLAFLSRVVLPWAMVAVRGKGGAACGVGGQVYLSLQ